jgi:hypothetical protein
VASQTFFDINAMLVELEQLETEERHVSDLRRTLHNQLDAFPNEVTAAKERKVSRMRRELHRRIDALRAQIELDGD